MSEIKNGRLGLYDAEHSKCNRMMTLGFKGLNNRLKKVKIAATSRTCTSGLSRKHRREKITSSSAMAERPRELDRGFSGVGHFEAKFWVDWLLFAPIGL